MKTNLNVNYIVYILTFLHVPLPVKTCKDVKGVKKPAVQQKTTELN